MFVTHIDKRLLQGYSIRDVTALYIWCDLARKMAGSGYSIHGSRIGLRLRSDVYKAQNQLLKQVVEFHKCVVINCSKSVF